METRSLCRLSNNIQAAVDAVRERTEMRPEMALVLGSGLGALAEAVEDGIALPTSELPGYPRSTVEGHQGQLVFGRLEGKEVVFIQGRAHLYEGHDVRAVAFPVRLVRALGARRLLLTNAAGGVNPSFAPGTLMFITDHINWTFRNPLYGMQVSTRGACLERPMYDADWIASACETALACGVATRQGTYLWTPGPSYETKAEIRAFASLGADAVGMSTVPEVIQARRLGMRVLGISTITNPAAGLGAEPLDHADVLAVGKEVRENLERLVRGIVRRAEAAP